MTAVARDAAQDVAPAGARGLGMDGDDYRPGRFERLFSAVPEGTVLRGVFLCLLAMAVCIIGLDYQEMSQAAADTARTARTEPMPLDLPTPGDQIRPYLPRTIPVGPDRGEPRLPGYDGPVDGTAMAQPMRFVQAPDGEVTAIGRIDPGTAGLLKVLLEQPGKRVRTLVLHSPGGSVVDAIEMARLLRARKIDTRVPADGYCASACPLMFSGGVQRLAGADAWVGVHQVFAVETPGATRPRDIDGSIADIQATIAECQQLLVDMGVKPEVWIKAMKTPADALYVLTPDELRDFAVVTPERFGPPMPDSVRPAA